MLLRRVPRLATFDLVSPMDWQVKAGILDEHGWWDRLVAMGWKRRRSGEITRPAPRNCAHSCFDQLDRERRSGRQQQGRRQFCCTSATTGV